MVKWMAAGIAAANLVGAVIAVQMTVASGDQRLATWLFVIGLIAALLSTMVFEHMVRVMENPALEADRYWAQVEHGGERDSRREADLQAKLKHSSRGFLVPMVAGATSVGCFVVGSALLFF